MKKKLVIIKRFFFCLFFITVLIVLIPTQIFAASPTITQNEPDGSVYKLKAWFDTKYDNSSWFWFDLEIKAITFGTLEGVIVALYNIVVDITVSGETYLWTRDYTFANLTYEGDWDFISFGFEIMDITDSRFTITTHFHFKGNNTQGEDPDYGLIWVPGAVKVKGASVSIILPILAVLSLAYLANRKWKR